MSIDIQIIESSKLMNPPNGFIFFNDRAICPEIACISIKVADNSAVFFACKQGRGFMSKL